MATREIEPTTPEDAASAMAIACAGGAAVRVVGGGTKVGWGAPGKEPEAIIRTTSLNRILEHNQGDLTAVLEAGVTVAEAQQTFATAGQMLALDPPLGNHAGSEAATIGGMIATADSGPLRHRYGAPRDLVVGMTVALSDGTIARSGGKVIKNVAGYDLAKLFAGSFGTLGMILSVNVRLHPLPDAVATALGTSADPAALARAAIALAAEPLELEALDVAWRSARGGLLARMGGVEAPRRAERVASVMERAGLEQVGVEPSDAGLWARQRAGQRSARGALVTVATRPSALEHVLRAADVCGGTLVGRAALGISYVELAPEAAMRFRGSLPGGSHSVLLDAPEQLRLQLDPWDAPAPAAMELIRRVKQQFDPTGACSPGVFVGGI